MTTKPRPDTPRTRWTDGITVPGGGWVHISPGAHEIFTGNALAPGWQRIVTDGPDKDGDFALFGTDNPTTYQFVRATDCEVSTEEPARPTVGDRVRIDAPDRPTHGRVGEVSEHDGTDIPYFVRVEDAGAEWFYAHQVSLVADGDTFPVEEGEKVAAEEAPEPGQPIRVLRRHVIVLEQPVSPDDLARAARALEPGMRVHVGVYTDLMEVIGTDPEPADG